MLLPALSVDDLISYSRLFDGLQTRATTMVEMAQLLTGQLQETLLDESGRRACALVRLYKTHAFEDLPPDLQDVARQGATEDVGPSTRCLTLIGTAGLEPDWNDRTRSRGHRAIPLTSNRVVEQSPMIAGLVRELGFDVAEVVRPAPMAPGGHHRTYDLFFVPDTVGSPFVPAQESFVAPYGIRSAVGCGGLLPSGDLFALIAFSIVPVPWPSADLFRSLALSIKSALMPFTFKTFAA